MIKEIEVQCDDVICLSQNFLQLSAEQFDSICAQSTIDMIVREATAELKSKEEELRQALLSADDSSFEDSDDESSSFRSGTSSSQQQSESDSARYLGINQADVTTARGDGGIRASGGASGDEYGRSR